MKNFDWPDVFLYAVIVVSVIAFLIGGVNGMVSNTIQEGRLLKAENALRIYQVEAAELRGYSQALRDAGVAPSPKGGAR